MPLEVKLPELGENVESVEVTKVLVSPGDAIEADQSILELETGKAVVEVPSPDSGTVAEVRVKEGDTIAVGDTILVLSGDGTGTSAPAAEPAPEPATAPEAPAGPPAAAVAPTPAPEVQPLPSAQPAAASVPAPAAQAPAPAASAPTAAPAAPSVRRFARELGLDVAGIEGLGPHGRVSADDVKRHARALREAASSAPAAASLPSLPDFGKWGETRREAMSSVRRATADQLSLSWSQIPHVTIFDKADITELEVLRKKYAAKAEALGGKLTMAVMAVKAVASALKIFPKVNASLDMARREVVFKDYVNVGIAVATPRGLLVPVIRDVDTKNMVQLAAEITSLALRARDGKVQLNELEGGTFTVTNLGRIGGSYFTPIVNYPEVAILGMGRTFAEASASAEAREPRTMLPLSLSFDHRLVDGADAAEFLGWIVAAIEEPLLLSLEG